MASPQKYLIKIAFLSGNSEYSICNAFPLVIKIRLPRRGWKHLQVNMYGAAIAARKRLAEQTAQQGPVCSLHHFQLRINNEKSIH